MPPTYCLHRTSRPLREKGPPSEAGGVPGGAARLGCRESVAAICRARSREGRLDTKAMGDGQRVPLRILEHGIDACM